MASPDFVARMRQVPYVTLEEQKHPIIGFSPQGLLNIRKPLGYLRQANGVYSNERSGAIFAQDGSYAVFGSLSRRDAQRRHRLDFLCLNIVSVEQNARIPLRKLEDICVGPTNPTGLEYFQHSTYPLPSEALAYLPSAVRSMENLWVQSLTANGFAGFLEVRTHRAYSHERFEQMQKLRQVQAAEHMPARLTSPLPNTYWMLIERETS